MLALLRHNFGYKLLALLFAVVLHFYVAGLAGSRPSHILVLPLTVRGLPPDLLLAGDLPSVALTLDGSSEEIGRLSDSSVTAWVELSQARAGRTPPLAVHLAGLPPDVSLESEPRPVALDLEARRRRQLAVSAADIGVAPAAYALTPPVVTPREAVVLGTPEAVGAVARLVAQAAPGQAAGAVDGDYALAALDAAGSPVSGVTVTPPTAHVRMDLIHAVSRKALVVSAAVVGTPAAPYRFGGVEVSPATVTAEGSPQRLLPLTALFTRPVDVSGATGDVVRRVDPVAPAGVTLSPPGPITVTVHLLAPPAPAPVLAPLPAAGAAPGQ